MNDHQENPEPAPFIPDMDLPRFLRIRYSDLEWLYRQRASMAVCAALATLTGMMPYTHNNEPAWLAWVWGITTVVWIGIAGRSVYIARHYKNMSSFFVDPDAPDDATG